MQYLMALLEKHYDSGFGATAEAFFRAAETLSYKGEDRFFLGHLPHNYLLRHAVELFLKSGIVILHRKLRIALGDGTDNSPMQVCVNGKWKAFHKTHSVQDLYTYWFTLLSQNAARLQEISPQHPKWDVPAKLNSWISTIEKTDSGSTYYRYPVTRDVAKDSAKSPFKEKSPEELFPKCLPKGEWVKALVIENQAGEAVAAYAFDYRTEETATEALISACEMLNNFHAMMRFELTDGW